MNVPPSPHQETCERLGKKEVGMFYSGTAHRQKKRGTLCRRGSPGMKNTNWVLLGTMRECLTLEDMAPTWICVRVCLCLSGCPTACDYVGLFLELSKL